MAQPDKTVVNKLTDGLTKDLPKLVTENKGAAIGALAGLIFADTISKNEALITSVLGALAGHVFDEKKKEEKF